MKTESGSKNIQVARHRGWLPYGVVGLLVLSGFLGWLGGVLGGLPLFLALPLDRLSTFAAVFLSIFFEAAPFLLLGSLGAGLVEVFVSRDELARWIPRGALAGALTGALIGLFFPVCECGVVPFTRRLLAKGLPLPSAVAVLLAAPAVNPIVIASTLAAYGLSPIFWGRIGFSFFIAVVTALLFSRLVPGQVLRPEICVPIVPDLESASQPSAPLRARLQRVLVITADEFFEMGRYLVLGALLAALMQAVVPQSALLAVGQGPVLSVVVMLVIAVLLSVCSTVDAFISLAFVSTFSSGAVLAFLVFGPMVDIKSTLMYMRVFKARSTALLVLIPLLLAFAAGVGMNWVLR